MYVSYRREMWATYKRTEASASKVPPTAVGASPVSYYYTHGNVRTRGKCKGGDGVELK